MSPGALEVARAFASTAPKPFNLSDVFTAPGSERECLGAAVELLLFAEAFAVTTAFFASALATAALFAGTRAGEKVFEAG
jgi:hypothetical protein